MTEAYQADTSSFTSGQKSRLVAVVARALSSAVHCRLPSRRTRRHRGLPDTGALGDSKALTPRLAYGLETTAIERLIPSAYHFYYYYYYYYW
jgi:hypothetical protein